MNTKRILSAFLAVMMLLGATVFSTTASAADMPFRDVKENKWFYDEGLYVYEKGLMTGTSEDKFEPNASLTRAMFITILGRLAGAEETESNKFSDIKKKSWYSGYVGWAVDSGIVTGYEDGTFKPDQLISRAEAVTMVNRVLQRIPQSVNDLLPGAAYVYAGGDSNDHGAVVQAILDEAQRLVREGIDEDYYQRLRRANFGTALKALNSFEAIAVSAAEGCFEGYDPFRFPEVYAAVTAEEVRAFLERVVTEDRCALAVVEPFEN